MTIQITFCTGCMGRLMHLRETLPRNLAAARPWANRVDFVLLDYHSDDGLEPWLREQHWPDVAAGRLTVYRTRRPTHYHISHAKNVAHLLARSPVLVNLDADNFIDAEYIDYLLREFAREPRQIFRGRRCAFGRIALSRSDFVALGGYDEDFCGWGSEDRDLLERAARALGRPVHYLPQFDQYIQHSHSLRTARMTIRNRHVSREANRTRMFANLERRRYVANGGRTWGRETVERNYDPADLVEVGHSQDFPSPAL